MMIIFKKKKCQMYMYPSTFVDITYDKFAQAELRQKSVTTSGSRIH